VVNVATDATDAAEADEADLANKDAFDKVVEAKGHG
jgi:hypothetical protein